MHVVLNGDATPLEGVRTVADLLQQLRVEGRIAVEINGEIVPRSRFTDHPVNDGDQIELVCAIGGG